MTFFKERVIKTCSLNILLNNQEDVFWKDVKGPFNSSSHRSSAAEETFTAVKEINLLTPAPVV